MEYVYHLKPRKLKGNSILSLSELKKRHSDLYKKEVAKYDKDRAGELDEQIRCLDATWRDVINLSTINPIKILSVAQLIGNETNPEEIFQIPITNLRDKEFCLFTDFDNKEKFKLLTVKEYREGKEIPLETIQHFVESKEDGVRPLIFEHIPHILVVGEVNIANAIVIKYDPKNLLSLASAFDEHMSCSQRF